jgi:hypothetical protein
VSAPQNGEDGAHDRERFLKVQDMSQHLMGAVRENYHGETQDISDWAASHPEYRN